MNGYQKNRNSLDYRKQLVGNVQPPTIRQGWFKRGHRKPRISPTAVKEFFMTGTDPYVIAQQLFGGPHWMPAGYTADNAWNDIIKYIKTGEFETARWTDMKRADLQGDLRAVWDNPYRGWKERLITDPMLDIRASDNHRRVAVLAAWLGGVKGSGRHMHVKKSYMRALSPTTHPGMVQQVYERFVKSGSKQVGGGAQVFELLKIGKTVRLVTAGTNVARMVEQAKNILNKANADRALIEAQRMHLRATQATLAAQGNTVQLERDRRAQLMSAEIAGRWSERAKIANRLKEMQADGQLKPEDFQRFLTGTRLQVDDYIKHMRESKARPEVIAQMQKEYAHIFKQTDSHDTEVAEEAQKLLIESSSNVGMMQKIISMFRGYDDPANFEKIKKDLKDPAKQREALIKVLAKSAKATNFLKATGQLDDEQYRAKMDQLRVQANQGVQYEGETYSAPGFDPYAEEYKHRSGFLQAAYNTFQSKQWFDKLPTANKWMVSALLVGALAPLAGVATGFTTVGTSLAVAAGTVAGLVKTGAKTAILGWVGSKLVGQYDSLANMATWARNGGGAA